MRLLWVKVGGLWPRNSGGRLRSFETVAQMAKRHSVTVLTTHAPEEDVSGLQAALPHCEEVHSVAHRICKQGTLGFAAAMARSWPTLMPVDLWRCRVPALRHDVERRLRQQPPAFDVCVADFLPGFLNVPRSINVPLVLFAHNVEHQLWQRLCRQELRPWRRALLELEWRKMRRFERDACVAANLTVAVSEADCNRLQELAAGARITHVPTGVDTNYFAPAVAPARPRTLVFTGSMDWYPNEDAILYFLNAILPHIRQRLPDVILTVVGRNPSARLAAAAKKEGVHLTGAVADVRPYVHAASVYVVPLRIAGGTRLKIFEALAMGKAVVSTSIGAEGLPLRAGTHFVNEDAPPKFAAAVVALLENPSVRQRLELAGRSLVERHFGWSEVARDFETHCLGVCRAS